MRPCGQCGFALENAAKSCPKYGNTDPPPRANTSAGPPPPAPSFLEPLGEATTAGIAWLQVTPIVLILGALAAYTLRVDLAILAASVGVVLILVMSLVIIKFWSDGGMDG